MIKAFIKGWKKVHGDSDTKPGYTVYLVEVNNNGLLQTVPRRYSEFDELYKYIKKIVPPSELPEFPGKHLMNRSSRLIEQRRLALDSYIRGVVHYYGFDLFSLPTKVVTFLNLSREATGSILQTQDSGESQPATGSGSFYTTPAPAVISDSTPPSTHPVMIFSDKPALDSVLAAFTSNSYDATLGTRSYEFRSYDSRFDSRPPFDSRSYEPSNPRSDESRLFPPTPFGISSSPVNQPRKVLSSPWRSSAFFGSFDNRSFEPRPLTNVVLEGTLIGLYGEPVLPTLTQQM